MKRILFCLMVLPVIGLSQPSFNMTLFANADLPNLPTRFGSEYNDCWGYRHSNGTEIAVIGGMEDIFFFNVTVPANPVLIHTHHVINPSTGTVNQSLWRDFKTYQHYLYAAADEGTSGLLIFDLSQVPTSVTLVHQTTEFWNRTHNIYIDEEHGRLYAAGSNSVSNGLMIVDLEPDPENPTIEAAVPLNNFGGGYVHDVHVRDNIAYCSHGSLSKVQIYDFSALPNITVVGTIENYPDPGYNHSSWLNSEGNLLVMADETHGSDLKTVDVSDPENISSDDFNTFYSELLGPEAPGSSVAHNPFILGDLVYVAYYHDGVQVFDITDPENIGLVAYYDTYPDNVDYNGYEGCWGVYPFLPSGIIIASDQNYGLYVMGITELPLDIEFLSFRAFRKNEDVRLEWTVADASFGNSFEVQRSTDGGVTFLTVGEVELETSESNYSFTDRQALGSTKYAYRIDFVQLDGHKIPSPLRYVRTEAAPSTIRVVNPISSTLVLDILQPIEFLDLELFNMEGAPVWSRTGIEGSAKMEILLDQVPAGHYLLRAKWNGGSENLIIQKAN